MLAVHETLAFLVVIFPVEPGVVACYREDTNTSDAHIWNARTGFSQINIQRNLPQSSDLSHGLMSSRLSFVHCHDRLARATIGSVVAAFGRQAELSPIHGILNRTPTCRQMP